MTSPPKLRSSPIADILTAELERCADMPNSARMLRLTLRTLEALPRWPVEQPREHRIAAMRPAFAAAAETWWRERRGLMLIGPTDAGKTVALVHALVAMWERGIRERKRWPQSLWLKSYAIANARKQSPLGAEAELIVLAQTVPVLVLDDLGQEQRVDTSVWEVIDQRYDALLPTLVSSGMTPEELTARYGESFVRRFLKVGAPGRLVSAFAPEQSRLRRVP